jgi:hypothetical protein
VSREVLHTVTKCISKGESIVIRLKDTVKRRAHRCRVITSNRAFDEKNLGGGWYKYVKERKIKVGDRLLFVFEESPMYMSVKVVNRTRRR